MTPGGGCRWAATAQDNPAVQRKFSPSTVQAQPKHNPSSQVKRAGQARLKGSSSAVQLLYRFKCRSSAAQAKLNQMRPYVQLKCTPIAAEAQLAAHFAAFLFTSIPGPDNAALQ